LEKKIIFKLPPIKNQQGEDKKGKLDGIRGIIRRVSIFGGNEIELNGNETRNITKLTT
jgi:hypothetical protein